MNLKTDKVIVYYFIGVVVFLMLKFLHTFADNDDLLFLTAPTNGLFSLVQHSSWAYSLEHGFAHYDLHVLIDKSCSGFNFFLLSANLFLFMLLPGVQSRTWKVLLFPISYLIAYLFTLFVNTSRILISLKLEALLPVNYDWLHQAEGAFIYLSFLITAYLVLNFIIQRHTTIHHEKLA